jgi:hypothetical protein
MRIERVIIRKLRALRSRDDRLVGLDGKTFPAACLRGLNGSGKTTYLEAIAELWQWFRLCTIRRAFAAPEVGSLLHEAELTAVLMTDLPGPRSRIWLAWGTNYDAIGEHPDEQLNPFTHHHHADVLLYWDELTTQAESGMAPDQWPPNVVWIEAENKYVAPLAGDALLRPGQSPAFVPLARYNPEATGAAHLEGLLLTLFLARRERWNLLARWIGALRPGLSLLDSFDVATRRPQFRLATGEVLTVDRLSAGERSLLINLCTILRWLSPGGIVLLDEPELHQHLSLMRASLAVLETIITEEFRGQLIVASHAPEVWDHFRHTGALIDLGDEPT